MAVADLAHPLEVTRRRREAAAGVLHGLEEDGGHRVGSLDEDGLLDGVGRPASEGLEVVGEVTGAVEVGVGHVHGAGDERFERGLDVGEAGDGEGSHGGAVVGDVPADDLGAAGLTGDPEVLPGELPGRLDRLRPTGGEEDAVAVGRGQAGQPVGELDGIGVGVAPHREVGQLRGLARRRLGQLGAPVPDLAGEQPRQPVEVPLAVLVVDPHPLTPHDGRDLLVHVRRQAGEVHPQVAVGFGLERLGVIVCRGASGHVG